MKCSECDLPALKDDFLCKNHRAATLSFPQSFFTRIKRQPHLPEIDLTELKLRAKYRLEGFLRGLGTKSR